MYFRLKSLFILACILGSFLATAQERDFFIQIDNKAQSRWEKLELLQNDNVWVEEQSKAHIYGPIFQKGWLNPKVARQIVPDKNEGLLLIDSITLGPKAITQAATLASNILLSVYFPYVQGGPIFEKTFTNTRKVKSFKEGLLARPFKLESIPLDAQDFSYLANDESISTVTTNGFFMRFSADVLSFLGVSKVIPLELGPKVKLHIKKTVRVSITKENDQFALISIENILGKGVGVGTGLGVYFEEMISLPVSIGINSANGYSPLLTNAKTSTQKIQSMIYKIDITDPEGIAAYQKFLLRDFTLIQDLSKVEGSAVTREIEKIGKINTKEKNIGVDLLIWRRGKRNINMKGDYKTTMKNGDEFEYQERYSHKISDRGGFSGKEKESVKFSVIVPVKSLGEESSMDKGFSLRSEFRYRDSKAKGKELVKISKTVKQFGFSLGLPVKFDTKKQYKEVFVEANLQFSASAISRILKSSKREVWIALATAFGLADPLVWETESSRTNYKVSKTKKKKLKIANKIVQVIQNFKKSTKLSQSAKYLIEKLQSKKIGMLLHKTMVGLVGYDLLMGRGSISGRNF